MIDSTEDLLHRDHPGKGAEENYIATATLALPRSGREEALAIPHRDFDEGPDPPSIAASLRNTWQIIKTPPHFESLLVSEALRCRTAHYRPEESTHPQTPGRRPAE
jgi:hypothetical protein